MKLRKLMASLTSACVAVSAMSIVSSAAVGSVDTTNYMREGDANNAVYVLADKEADPNWSADTGIAPTDVYGVTYHIEFNADEVADESAWIGGGIGANSQSTGWLSNEWGRNEKPIIADLENGTVTWLSDKPVFAETDTYCQFWIQAWGGTITVTGADILGADGNVLDVAAEDAAEAVALDGTVNAALYVGESATWVTAASDAQAISNTGSYTFKIDGLAIPADKLTVIYVKDADVEGGAATETAINADTQIITKSVKVNDTELTLTDGYNTALAKNVLDVCWYNIWGTNYVDLGDIAEINSVEVTVEFAIGAAEEAPAEDEAADEEAAEEDEAADEEEAEEDEAADEEEAEDEEDADEAEDEVAEVDWDSYDADAMAAANEEFTLGGAIDIYSVVGDSWEDIAVVEADFVWTPGLGGWCGGAGVGNGAVAADGSTWISGPEYGCANRNADVEPDGKATQVIVDLTENPLTAIASVGEDGTTTFAHIQIQNWWNGVEANAQVAAVRFLDADGEVLGELTYDVDVPEAPVEDEAPVVEDEAPATGDVDAETDSSKGSPDTGVEDVAVVAGLAIVAAGAVLVSKKRK